MSKPRGDDVPATNEANTYADLKFRDVLGTRMAYLDEGQGDAIVFQHGNPTWSYLWRNVMPHLQGMGRLVACDLVGMGGSDKLSASGPGSYHYAEQRDHLFALWDNLELGDRVILVLHDWGSVLGFDWARHHPDRVHGIAFMEAITTPMRWSELAEPYRNFFQPLRTPDGERIILQDNAFVEQFLPQEVIRPLSDAEMDHYRRPYRQAGEDRRPTLSWPRNIPFDGQPADIAALVTANTHFLAHSNIPKLFVNANPGTLIRGPVRRAVRSWPHLTEVTVPGKHFLQEDSPHEIGRALADFVRGLREQPAASTPADST